MDIHRSRFVSYPTCSINALAFSHSSLEELPEGDSISSLRLAVGRSNGDVEIWNPGNGAWIHETTFHGAQGRSIEGLVWIQDVDVDVDVDDQGNTTSKTLRLFSIGYSNTVTEWNLTAGLPLRHWSGNHSDVWCFAAQPRLPARGKGKMTSNSSQNLVIGCADGTLAFLSTADDDLQFQKFLARPTAKKARVLSVTFQSRATVVAGFADSTIRIYDVETSSIVRNVTLGAGPRGGPREILVWKVKCLPNGDIVSGDSTGEVRFYEGKNFGQYQRITGHDADVLDLAVCSDGKTVYSAGMDRRTVVYTNSSKRRWAKAFNRSYHEHDVKAMATFESKKLSVIASGGVDTNLVIIPLRGFWKEYQRTISGLPQQPPLTSSPSKRLFASWWERQVNIWYVGRRAEDDKSHKLVARLAVKGDENVSSAALSEDVELIAISTAAEVKIFSLLFDFTGNKPTLAVKKLKSSVTLPGSRLIQFSQDGKWLALITSSNHVRIARMITQDGEQGVHATTVNLNRLQRQKIHQSISLGHYLRTITRLLFSPDSKALVVSDMAGYIDAWFLDGEEGTAATSTNGTPKRRRAAAHSDSGDSESDDDDDDDDEPTDVFGQNWRRNPAAMVLPKLDSAPLILSFRPLPTNQRTTRQTSAHHLDELLVITSMHNLYEFSLSTGTLTDWSRRNPTQALPERFRTVKDRAIGSVWGVSNWWWIYGVNWVMGMDMAADHIVERGTSLATTSDGLDDSRGLKRKWGDSGAGDRKKPKDSEGMLVQDDEEAAGRSPNHIQNGVSGGDEDDEDEHGPAQIAGLRVGDAMVTSAAEHAEDHPKSWCTFKYRPILGMVPISNDTEKEGIEVVLVERPIWDLDLPPRFEGAHER